MTTYKSDEDFRKALEARLKLRFEAGEFFNLDHGRAYVAFERYLLRLLKVSPNDWALKGGLSLEYRLNFPGRTTRDIDLDVRTTSENVEDALERAIGVELEDRFYFSDWRLKGTNALDGTDRYTIACTLAGRAWCTLPIDVGQYPSALDPVDVLTVPSFLSFDGFPPLKVPVTSIAQQIAEKLHAYVKPRPSANSRVKDLVDLQLLINLEETSPTDLAHAVEVVFKTEANAEIPKRFPYPSTDWSASYSAAATRQNLPADLRTAHDQIADHLDPVLKRVASDSKGEGK